MSFPYPIPVTATQVGTYFVGQYYKVMEQQPDYVHQFYSDASTILRVRGSSTESAAGLLQIHSLIMSIKYSGYEIFTAHALESWSGGVVVMVSGSLNVKEVSGRRKFVETFFLAPQEKGYFVLNDVFHLIEEDSFSPHPAALQTQKSFEPQPSRSIPETDLSVAPDSNTNGHYNFPPKPHQVSELENSWEMNSRDDHISSQDHHLLQSIDDSSDEPVKHTYASILLATSSKPNGVNLPQSKKDTTEMERNLSLQKTPLDIFETSAETHDEVLVADDEYEIRSVYVKNLPPEASESEIEEEFSKFGNIAPEGIVVRTRKDTGVCYAFVEFQDMASVHNAVQAGYATVSGCHVYIEGRRSNNNLNKGRSRANEIKGSNGFREHTKLRHR